LITHNDKGGVGAPGQSADFHGAPVQRSIVGATNESLYVDVAEAGCKGASVASARMPSMPIVRRIVEVAPAPHDVLNLLHAIVSFRRVPFRLLALCI